MPPPTTHQRKLSHRFKALGLMVLALGLTSAALIYWIGREPAVSSQPDEPLPMLDSKVNSRALEENQGKTGVLLVRLRDEMSRPGPLALVIAAASTIIALVCFRIADWFSVVPSSPDKNQKNNPSGGV